MSAEHDHSSVTRRRFVQGTAAVVGGLVLSGTAARWVYAVSAPLDPATQRQFVENLPIPAAIDATGGGTFEMQIRQASQNLGLINPGGGQLRTTVFGYGPKGGRVTYPGPTFVAKKDVDVDVRWVNLVPGRLFLPVDTTVHRSDPVGPADRISVVTHLHGGRNESPSDGLPDAWFTQNFSQTGPQFVKQTYHYDNAQEAGNPWYHDHSLGITRLNVYAGLAGFYLLRDDNELGLISGGVLPSGAFEIGLAVQDRSFEANGQLFRPSSPADAEFVDSAEVFDPANVTGLNPTNSLDPVTLTFERPEPNPTIVAEFFGDFVLVNGKIWPKLSVTPDLYRFRVLNGSDSRFYLLKLEDKPRGESPTETFDFFVIGSDLGFRAQPVKLTELLIAPGERYDIIVDFDQSNLGADADAYLNNYGPDGPFSVLPIDPEDLANDITTGRVMKFEVRGDSVGSAPNWAEDVNLRAGGRFTVPGPADTTRILFLFEGLDDFGRLQPQLGTSIDADGANSRNSRLWFEPVTENPGFDDVEVWEIYNTTGDAHPIHLHLVAFEILSRQPFTIDEPRDVPQPEAHGTFGVGKDVNVASILLGTQRGPEPQEQAAKDTAVMLPGEVTRITAKFSPPNHETSADGTISYVWHCHILSHEDHEMMRPYVVGT